MTSQPQLCATDLSFISSLSFLFLFFFLTPGVQGATLREPSLWENELDSFLSSLQTPPPPSVAMLQALQYIQSLSQQSLHDPVINNKKPPDHDPNDAEHVRAMFQLATPAKSSGEMHNGRGEELDSKEDKGQQRIQAVLGTLQMTPMKKPHRATSHFLTPTHSFYLRSPVSGAKQEQDWQTDVENYGRNWWVNHGVRRHHRRIPLMFDDEAGELLKRTNENAEKQYTPQKLATLQSVFEELGQIANSKAYRKQQNNDHGDSVKNNEGNDGYREKKMVLEDEAREEDELWPLEETTQQEEEETQKHREFNGYFGIEDDEKQLEGDSDRDRDDEASRLDQSNFFEMEKVGHLDDISRLADYYLRKVQEKSKQKEQKRDQAEEKEEEDKEEENDGEKEREGEKGIFKRREAQLQYTVDPQSFYQLLQISKKLEVPTDDIFDFLESDLDKAWQRTPTQTQMPSVRYKHSYNTYKNPAFTARHLFLKPETGSVTQNILKILGLVNVVQQNNKSILGPNQYKSALTLNYKRAPKELPDYTFSENSRDQQEAEYSDTVDEKELASYLAAEMLAQRPRRTPLLGQELEETGGNSDEERLLNILNYLNPGSEETDGLDNNGKPVPGL